MTSKTPPPLTTLLAVCKRELRKDSGAASATAVALTLGAHPAIGRQGAARATAELLAAIDRERASQRG